MATAIDRRGRGRGRGTVAQLLRLWSLVLLLNVVGGGIAVLVFSVDRVLPDTADRALHTVAEEIATKDSTVAFASAVVGGAIVTLLPFLLQAVDQVLSRMALAYLIGFLLAVGPFAHVRRSSPTDPGPGRPASTSGRHSSGRAPDVRRRRWPPSTAGRARGTPVPERGPTLREWAPTASAAPVPRARA